MSTRKLLIVDDSPTELKLITDVFNTSEYDVVTAEDGEAGVEMAIAEKPELIILDVVMPKMNGFQACRKIKSLPDLENIPVILLTSKNQKSDEFWGKKQGADVYLTKPFHADQVLEAVTGLLS
ncbi:MAG: response regulator [Candidatus Electrothrix sp. LOE1_4_5]|jgi:twitching motility two-component system response regulator PilH|nr:response regulator [Candidatus Electrothrix sp. AX1]MCI5117705.1 response regulator [Candidatus Electrothrix gigas]MCI5127262.1 response regulator [Candidatus Electrothrix gigas]MCI5180005.1 response regulator [Candidatus Electrothrix gigas]MCI5182747.1 response regulator [Candidatus Electrothrix gigas]